jgi:hypothetical protein
MPSLPNPFLVLSEGTPRQPTYTAKVSSPQAAITASVFHGRFSKSLITGGAVPGFDPQETPTLSTTTT